MRLSNGAPILRIFYLGMLCTCIFSSTAIAKQDTLLFAPAVLKELKNKAPSAGKSNKKQRLIQNEFFKFMSLTPKAKVTKLSEMKQCLVKKRLIKDTEYNLILNVYKGLATGKVSPA